MPTALKLRTVGKENEIIVVVLENKGNPGVGENEGLNAILRGRPGPVYVWNGKGSKRAMQPRPIRRHAETFRSTGAPVRQEGDRGGQSKLLQTGLSGNRPACIPIGR